MDGVAAVSTPSDLAAEFAEHSGQTWIGFLRDGRMNVYTHCGRLEAGKGPGLAAGQVRLHCDPRSE